MHEELSDVSEKSNSHGICTGVIRLLRLRMGSRIMKVLVTGAAGFIGFHLTLWTLLERGDEVVGVDNLNDYYDPQLKQDRLDVIDSHARSECIHVSEGRYC